MTTSEDRAELAALERSFAVKDALRRGWDHQTVYFAIHALMDYLESLGQERRDILRIVTADTQQLRWHEQRIEAERRAEVVAKLCDEPPPSGAELVSKVCDT
jgi:hypothetical protein